MSVNFGVSNFFPNRSFIQCMALSTVIGVSVSGTWLWQSGRKIQSFCDQAVLDQQKKIVLRGQAEQKARMSGHGAKDNAELLKADSVDRLEQLKWMQMIQSTSTRIKSAAQEKEALAIQVESHRVSSEVSEEDASFWSFQRLLPVDPPQVEDSDWCLNPIDQFILAGLEEVGLSPNPPASRRILGRRLSFDLIGLPLHSDEIKEFVKAENSQAYNILIERLLENPGFGERWGRVWLDLARYADSNGYEEDELRPNAYTFRDFVIWAMNVDLPYDEFIRMQIAGDELTADNPLAVAATGFFTSAPLNTFIPQKSERYDELDDMVSTMGTAMLGLTIGCARCHDHEYDPIPTDEYYGLVSIFFETSRKISYLVPDGGKEYRKWFDPVNERRQEIKKILMDRVKEDNINELDYFTEEEKDLLRQPIDPSNLEQERLISLCERCLLITDDHLSDDLSPLTKDRERFKQLKAELKQLELALPPQPPRGLTLTGSKISKSHILEGGDLNRKQKAVGPGFLAALTKGRPEWSEELWKAWAPVGDDGELPKTRSALAYWMTDVEQGAGALLARVIVNRLWQHHFGEGLVRSSSDFGNQGDLPSHPELLEWLANELVNNNWSLKHIHRQILTSATYRQSNVVNEKKRNIDPENRLWGRRVPQRLTAEMMRDSMLLVAGNLNQSMYGPGVKPPIPRDAVYNTQEEPEDTWPCDYEADRPSLWRRSIYVMLKRTVPVPMLRLFDAPDGSFSCHKRKLTTVPTQALALWNAPFVIKQSERLSDRIYNMETDRAKQIEQIFHLTMNRKPTSQEYSAATDFLQRNGNSNPMKKKQRLAELCHVIFMSNEFFYVD